MCLVLEIQLIFPYILLLNIVYIITRQDRKERIGDESWAIQEYGVITN